MVEVGSQLSGQIAEILADFNTKVITDQLIARIDPQTFGVRVKQAEADLKVAEANIAVSRASVSRAQANLRRAKLDYERQQPLVKKGSLPVTALDAARAALDISKAELEMARAQSRNSVASSEQRRASLQAASIDFERTQIRSPIDGVVIERNVDVGQTVAASLSSPTLFKIAKDLRQIQVEANVDEADIGNVKENNIVTFTVDAFPDLKFSGRVGQVRLAPMELQNVVTYTVIIVARNPGLKLLPGMTANVEIVTGKRADVKRIANEALRFRPPDTQLQVSGDHFEQGNNRNRGGGALIQRLKKSGVKPENIEKINAAISTEVAKLRQQLQSGGIDREQFRAQIKLRRNHILASLLSKDQMNAFKKTAKDRSDSKSAEIWVENADGSLQRRKIRVGISDDHFTEVVSGKINLGEKVITRMRTNKK